MVKEIPEISGSFDRLGYVVDEELATVLYLMQHLKKPILLEGNPGVGKTELAHVLATSLQTELIRLQCYEGLDAHTAIYEWNYQKQLLSIKIQENSGKAEKDKERHIFSEEFLLPRPLLRAISAKDKSPVLLIDEIDRADEEFEAFLLELLSVYQISIPEFGTIKAQHPPWVILTSNRTRELSDALRRRCLYHWMDYPDFNKELRIVQKKLPDIETTLARKIVEAVHILRNKNLEKAPGISETLDWAMGLCALGYKDLNGEAVHKTLGSVLKSRADIEKIREAGWEKIVEEVK